MHQHNPSLYTEWELPHGAIARLGKGAIRDIKYSPDGNKLAAATYIGIWIYDVNTCSEITLLSRHNEFVYSLAFLPDGTTLASTGEDNKIRLWDINTGYQLATIMTADVYDTNALEVSPDGTLLLTAGWDKTIRFWDVNTRRNLFNITGHEQEIYDLAFSPDGKTIASASRDETIRLWDTCNGRHITTLNEHKDSVTALTYSPNGEILVSGSADETVYGT